METNGPENSNKDSSKTSTTIIEELMEFGKSGGNLRILLEDDDVISAIEKAIEKSMIVNDKLKTTIKTKK